MVSDSHQRRKKMMFENMHLRKLARTGRKLEEMIVEMKKNGRARRGGVGRMLIDDVVEKNR